MGGNTGTRDAFLYAYHRERLDRRRGRRQRLQALLTRRPSRRLAPTAEPAPTGGGRS